ncbi:MAG: hypothetical protein ACRC4M_01580 [Mycoplasma sp.]
MNILKNKMGKIGTGVLALGLAGTVAGAVMLPVTANTKKTNTAGNENMTLGTGWVNWYQEYDENGKPLDNKEQLKQMQDLIIKESGSKNKSDLFKKLIRGAEKSLEEATTEQEKEEIEGTLKIYKSMQSNDTTKIVGIIMLAIGGAALLAGAGVIFYDYSKSKKTSAEA